MTNFSVITVARGKDDPPLRPYVYVVLSEHFEDSGGNIMVSGKLMDNSEIEGAVALLIKQLEKTQNKAKKALQQAKKKEASLLCNVAESNQNPKH
jgi:hypothetical protein